MISYTLMNFGISQLRFNRDKTNQSLFNHGLTNHEKLVRQSAHLAILDFWRLGANQSRFNRDITNQSLFSHGLTMTNLSHAQQSAHLTVVSFWRLSASQSHDKTNQSFFSHGLTMTNFKPCSVARQYQTLLNINYITLKMIQWPNLHPNTCKQIFYIFLDFFSVTNLDYFITTYEITDLGIISI